jgi:single-strand DNA-binding protein
MNRVLLTGRLTRDPELRTTSSGKSVTQFSVASHEFVGGKERPEFHDVVAWGRLAETAGRYLSKGQLVAVEGRIQTRTWDDDQGKRHWRTEIVAARVEMLSGRRRRDAAGERAATELEQQAIAAGIGPADASEPMPDDDAFVIAGAGGADDEDDESLDDVEASEATAAAAA